MNYSSSYELKKCLKRLGYDLEGLQAVQTDNGFQIQTLNPTHLNKYKPLLHELADVLKGSNATVRLSNGVAVQTCN